MKIHYETGGSIDHIRGIARFTTLCGKVFSKWPGSEFMQSGYTGAQNTTCKNCRAKLNAQKLREKKLERLEAKYEKDRLAIINN